MEAFVKIRGNNGNGNVTKFKPEEAKKRDAIFDAGLQLAKKMRNPEAVQKAAYLKVQHQGELVAWWDKNVTVRQSPGGKNRASNADRRSMISVAKAEELTGITQQQVSKWRKRHQDVEQYVESLCGPFHKKYMAETDAHVSRNTGESEWYTPAQYIEAARTTMGTIDLDPASCGAANEIVKAAQYYDEETDGLKQNWYGNVWLNPPYSQPFVRQFSEKLLEELPNIRQACVLVNNATDTEWLQSIMQKCSAVCFIKGRVKFLDQDGNPGAPLQGQVILYFGTKIKTIVNQHKEFGVCMSNIKDVP